MSDILKVKDNGNWIGIPAIVGPKGDKGDPGSSNTWYATCSTAAGTAAKVATSQTGDFTLATGNMVRVKFTYRNSQTEPTISIDGSTAKRIKNAGGTSQITTDLWREGEVIDLVYDGTDFIMSEGGTASASWYGVTKLSNSYMSTSQSLAATPAAVKAVYDIASAAYSSTNVPPYPVTSVNSKTGSVALDAGDVDAFDLKLGTSIPENASLDNYTTPGSYYVANAAVAATVTNSPVTNMGYKLIVFSLNANTYIMQMAFTYNGQILRRVKNANGWTGWYKISEVAL